MKNKGLHTIYDIAAEEFEIPSKETSLSVLLLRMSGVFVTITLVVFLISNHEYIRSQFFTWNEAEASEGNFSVDSDGDQIPDWWEGKYGFNAQDSSDSLEDADGDEVSNLMEYRFGTDPRRTSIGDESAEDSDGDGMSDEWEMVNGLDRKDFGDGSLDYDGDGFENLEEFELGTDPQDAYSDRGKN